MHPSVHRYFPAPCGAPPRHCPV
uniref:Uncharacterized protein n=1 Tax=Arundo donax TaxID=35708 RepID=A0A0A8Z3A0_ARUDO